MKKNYFVQFCLDDFKSGKQAVEVVFDIIEKVKAAVFAQSGKVVSYSYSNVLDRECNINGMISTITFEIATHDEYYRELVVDYWMDATLRDYHGSPLVYPMVSFRRSASTTVPLSNLDPGVGESQSVRV
jgi:hypothetical protein